MPKPRYTQIAKGETPFVHVISRVVAKQPAKLMRFAGNPRLDMQDGLEFRLQDYLELVDWTGRQIRADKRGSIPSGSPAILDRLDIDEEQWLFVTQHFESSFKSLVGSVYSLLLSGHPY